MSDIFEEVEQEYRKDRFSEFWESYGIYAWILAAAILGAVAFREVQTYRTGADREARLETLEAAHEAVTADDYAAARDRLAAIDADGTDLDRLTAHMLAGTVLEGFGNPDAATEALNAVADPEGDPLEQLATLKIAYLRADMISREELETILGPLARQGTPMGALAKELVAAKALEEGDIETARALFSQLSLGTGDLSSGAEPPRGVQQRASIALAALPAPINATPAAPAPTPAATDTPDPQNGADLAPEDTPAND